MINPNPNNTPITNNYSRSVKFLESKQKSHLEILEAQGFSYKIKEAPEGSNA